MARYFFDISKGANTTRDVVGLVCRDDEAALRYAWLALPKMALGVDIDNLRQRYGLAVRREDNFAVGRVAMSLEVERQSPVTAAYLSPAKA